MYQLAQEDNEDIGFLFLQQSVAETCGPMQASAGEITQFSMHFLITSTCANFAHSFHTFQKSGEAPPPPPLTLP